MNSEQAYDLLVEWAKTKSWDIQYRHMSNSTIFGWGNDNILFLYMEDFKKWKDLKKQGYSDDELINYFLDVVRKQLPQLKNLTMHFRKNIHFTYEKIKI